MIVHPPDLHAPIANHPLFGSAVPAGFPSPAEDYMEGPLDLNEHLVRTPAATFFVRVTGDSMVGLGINSGDLLIVDRSLSPAPGRVVIAAINGELTVKQFCRTRQGTFLVAANANYPPRQITEETGMEIWGIVTYVVHRV